MKKNKLGTLAAFGLALLMAGCTSTTSFTAQEPDVSNIVSKISKAHVIDLKQGTGNVSVNVNMKSETNSFTLKQITNGFESSVANVGSVEVRLFAGAPATWATPEDMWNDSGNQVASITLNSVSANNSIRFTGLLNGQDYSVSARAFADDPNQPGVGPGTLASSNGTPLSAGTLGTGADQTANIFVGDVITWDPDGSSEGPFTLDVALINSSALQPSDGGGSCGPGCVYVFSGGSPTQEYYYNSGVPMQVLPGTLQTAPNDIYTSSQDWSALGVKVLDGLRVDDGVGGVAIVTVTSIAGTTITVNDPLGNLSLTANYSNVVHIPNAVDAIPPGILNITSSNGAGGMGTGSDVGGGTAPARGGEYISVDSNGVLSIPNDDANNILDIDIQLMQDLTAEVDGSVNITPGDDADSGGPTEGIATP